MAKEREIQINSGDEETSITPEEQDQDTDIENGDENPVIESEVEILSAKVAELEDKLLRSAAEFENYKKRMHRQRDDLIRAASDRQLFELLDVVDNFERALEHNNEEDNSLKEGMTLIYNQLKEYLARYNVTVIEAVGEKFDPELHEAVIRMASDQFEDGLVAMEVTKGYRIGSRVLRHSKVGVSTGPDNDIDSEDK